MLDAVRAQAARAWSRRASSDRRGRVAALSVVLAAALSIPLTVRAYTDFRDYARPIENGGGGGRFFSGSPGDPYSCDVCHEGGEPAPLRVNGLPLDGYEPGETYLIQIAWGEAGTDAPAAAMMAEFTDRFGEVAGTTQLLPLADRGADERCLGGASPALDVCRLGDEAACCRRVDPTRDECSFPGERSVLWMRDCGAEGPLRARWTAPASGDVWFSASLVRSDKEQDVLGDGVTLVRTRLRAVGSPEERLGAQGECDVGAVGAGTGFGRGPASTSLGTLVLLAAVGWREIKRRGSRGDSLAARGR